MKKSQLIGASGALLSAFITMSAHAALIGVLPDGLGNFQAYYDDQLDISWTANANINGTDTWDNQVTWAAGLDIDGVTGWRLPSADVDGDGVAVDCRGGGVIGCADNEMGFLYWETGITAATPGPFSNVDSFRYWSGTESASDPTTHAWTLRFSDGISRADRKNLNRFAWAVHSGNVGVVPVPAAVWLFGSGLIGLLGLARRKR